MPICKRDGFDNAQSKTNKDAIFHDNDEVFLCEVTKQIFRDYEDYFRHVMVINSTVWQCEATGHEHLTYAEALKSERRARKKMELFKDALRPPVMLVIEHAKQSSFKSLNAIVSKFLRKRYFRNEDVSACHRSTIYNAYKVLDILPPGKTEPATGVYEDTDNLLYKLQRLGGNAETEITVLFKNLRRQRSEFNTENLQMFIKHNTIRVDGLLRPKPESYKKYVSDRKLNFASIFIGSMPTFTPAKHNGSGSKKQSSMNKFLVKSSEEGVKTNAQELARRERERTDKAEAKARTLKEEMERIRREKQEKLLEMERQRAEKRQNMMQRIEAECTALLTKTDDLERTDQRPLPAFATVQTILHTRLLGDAFMLREFMHYFVNILTGIDLFRGNLSFFEMTRALTIREVAGPLSDILIVLLNTVFDLQRDEEDECSVEYLLLRKELQSTEPFATMSLASRAHFYARRHYSFKINELPVDALALSEVLRLHLLSSGASVNERTDKWRVMYRNGYTSSEDPGLALRMQHPHILRALKMYTIYQLPFLDVMRVLRCLMAQIMTYSGTINVIEERMELMSKARHVLRDLTIVENRRLATVQVQKRTINNEYQQELLKDGVKGDMEKVRQLREKLNKRITELLAQSERDRKKYEKQVENQYAALFNFLVFLGMDRAYRKYYVLESMPGIFIEHPLDSMDTCLSDPPRNTPVNEVFGHAANLPKIRKDLRAYLWRAYTDEEKRTAAANKIAGATQSNTTTGKNKKGQPVESTLQENKENHINGLTNGHDASAATVAAIETAGASATAMSNGVANIESDDDSNEDEGPKEKISAAVPTQYELYMCTGDPRNCIVHDERNADRQRWAYIYEPEDIDALIEALNPLGERESQLREQLSVLRTLLIAHAKNCPTDVLSIGAKQAAMQRQVMTTTARKYGRANFGYADGADLNEVMYGTLVDRVLQFENEIFTGDLGRLKVKDMKKWREDLLNNAYDPQVKLQWGAASTNTAATGGASVDDDEGLAAPDDADGGRYANKPYRDPGDGLGDTMIIDSEDSADESISLHDSHMLRTCVKNLASALLQVEQAIERRFLKEPFGAPLKETKDKELLERKLKVGAERLKQWEVSLMESNSYAQVFLHMNVLKNSIIWARSTNKSQCQVCRRGSDPEKMLLCDECNGGTHMFCMKPKMKTVPEGNWYCQRCVTRLGLKNEKADDGKRREALKRKRKFVMDYAEKVNDDEDEEEEEEEEAAEEEEEMPQQDEEDVKSDCSSVSSAASSAARGKRTTRRTSGRRNKHAPSSNDMDIDAEEDDDGESAEGNDLADAASSDYDKDGEDDIENDAGTEVVDGNEDSDNDEQAEGLNEDDDDGSEAEQEEENVCIVCSYEGSDLFCVRCKDCFHLECVDLKRPPRYNFLCVYCKTKEERKRKAKPNGRHDNDDSSDEDDADAEENANDTPQPSPKRSRQSRTSLRNSAAGHQAQLDTNHKPNSSRRSKRGAESLPLNNSALYELLDDATRHEQAWPFRRPVLQSEVPDYYKIIKQPMDLAKVKSKLNMGAYQLNEEVMNDVQLIFSNCDKYNVKGNEVYQAGATLEQYVMQRCKDLNLPFRPSDMME